MQDNATVLTCKLTRGKFKKSYSLKVPFKFALDCPNNNVKIKSAMCENVQIYFGIGITTLNQLVQGMQ